MARSTRYAVQTLRNGVDIDTLCPSIASRFPCFAQRAAAERYVATLNAHASRHAPLLRSKGVVIEYRVVATRSV